jgi:hypothetical protein
MEHQEPQAQFGILFFNFGESLNSAGFAYMQEDSYWEQAATFSCDATVFGHPLFSHRKSWSLEYGVWLGWVVGSWFSSSDVAEPQSRKAEGRRVGAGRQANPPTPHHHPRLDRKEGSPSGEWRFEAYTVHWARLVSSGLVCCSLLINIS